MHPDLRNRFAYIYHKRDTNDLHSPCEASCRGRGYCCDFSDKRRCEIYGTHYNSTHLNISHACFG